METQVTTSQHVLSQVVQTGWRAANPRRRGGQAALLAAMALAVAGAAGGAAANTVYTYTPNNAATDTWSAGTDWSATPVSSFTTTLTFVSNNNTVLGSSLANTSTDDNSGAFDVNVINLQGTGPASGAGSITIAASAGSYLDIGGSSPQINLNANSGTAGLTYNVSAPITLGANITIQGNGTANFNISGDIGETAGQNYGVTKSGSSTVTLSGTDNYTGATDVNGGDLILTGADNFGAGSVTVNAASTLDVAGGSMATTGNLEIYGTLSAEHAGAGAAALGDGNVYINTGGVISLQGSSGNSVSYTTADATTSTTFNLSGFGNLNLNANGGDVSYTIGNSGRTSSPIVRNAGTGGGLIITPTNLTTLGSTEQVFLKGQAATANSILPAYLVVQDQTNSDAGDFAAYDATKGVVAGSQVAGLYVNESSTSLDTENSTTAVFNVDAAPPALTGNRQVFALRDNGYAIDTGGNTLTIGNNTGQAGLILNGSATIGTTGNPGTLGFGAAEAVVYVNANATINSAMSFTSGNGLTLMGPGTLNLPNSETLPGLSGAANLNLGGGTFTIGNSSGLNTTYTGTLTGSGNITKTGSSTLTLGGVDNTYTGSINVTVGALDLGGSPAELFTPGTLTLASGTTLGGSGVYPVSAAFSGLFGSGQLAARVVVVNYNGSAGTPDNFAGQINNGGLWKDGVGTLNLTNTNIGGAGFVNAGLNVNYGTLSLDALPSTSQGGFNVGNGTLIFTGTSGVVAGAESSQSAFLSGGDLILRPSLVGSSTDISVSGFGGAATEGDSFGDFRASGAGTLVLDPNGNRSLTFTIGSTTAKADSTHSVMFVQVQGGASFGGSGSLILAPATGLATLGTTTRFVVLQAGESGFVGDPTNLINGMTDANVIGQSNDANKSGSFLTYVHSTLNTYAAGDPGFEAVTYTNDTNNAAFYAGTSTNTAIEDVTTGGSLATNSQVFALRDSGQTIDLNGHTLTIGDNVSGHAEGLIMNGGTIAATSGGTLSFGSNSTTGEIYTSLANGEIDTKVTANNGLDVFGPGVLTLGASSSGISGGITINGSTLDAPASAMGSNVLVLNNGVYQYNGSFTRTLGTNNDNSHLYFKAGGGFAARGGAMDVLLNNSNSTPLVWGNTAGFLPDTGALLFGSATADSTVNFENNIDLGSTNIENGNNVGIATPNYTRVINVYNNPNSTTDIAEMSGVISSTSPINILAKDGAGVLQLTNANTYAGGTIVNAGTLEVDNASGSGTGTGYVNVYSGATLAGGGSIAGAVSASSGAMIHPGDLGALAVANLTVSSLTVDPATFEFSLDSSGNASQVVDTGAFTQTGTGANTVDISALGSSLLDQTYTLMTVADGGLSLSDFAFGNGNTTESLLVGSNSYLLTLGITGTNSNDLVLTVSQPSIPEPAALGLLAVGGLGLLVGKRRRKLA